MEFRLQAALLKNSVKIHSFVTAPTKELVDRGQKHTLTANEFGAKTSGILTRRRVVERQNAEVFRGHSAAAHSGSGIEGLESRFFAAWNAPMNVPAADNLNAPLGPPQSRPETFDALTGLRGVAACWVAIFHFNDSFTSFLPAFASLHWLFVRGNYAVPMFFLLSGFVLTHTYWTKFQIFRFQAYRDYMWFRFARMYPAYLMALLVMVSLVAFSAMFHVPFNRTSYPLETLPFELLMLHTWGSMSGIGWNYPSWSVSSEWFAYIFAFPAAIWIGKRILQPALVLGVVGLLLAFVIWRAARPAQFLSFGYTPLETSILFLAGSLAWHLRMRIPWKRWLHLDSIAAVGVVLSLVFSSNLHPVLFEMAMFISFTCLIVGLSQQQGFITKFLNVSIMVWLGEISYSLYLTHGVVKRALKPLVDRLMVVEQPVGLRILLLILNLGLILGAAAALYYSVERPGREWLRKIYLKRRGKSI